MFRTRIPTARNWTSWLCAGAAASLALLLHTASFADVAFKEVRPPDAELNYSGIAFADDTNGLMIGEQVFENEKATIAVTHDKGRTWEVQKGLAAGRLLGGFMYDAQNAWVVGERGTVLATTDGGKTWDTQTSKALTDLYDVFFISPKKGWAVGQNSTVVTTSNGGRTWQVLLGGQPSGQVGEGEVLYMGVHFLDETRGFAVGAGEQGIIVTTADGGKTWETVYSVEDNLHDIEFADATHGWVVGKFGEVIATSDGGKTWAPQTSNTEEDLYAISAADAQHVWMSGNYGTIAYTSDGGATWQLVGVQVDIFGTVKQLTQRVPAVAAEGNEAWAATDFGRVLYFRLQ